MKKRLLVVHGGAPTAVINASLYGVIKEAEGRYDAVYGAKGGSGGILREEFADLLSLPKEDIERLPHTPGSMIGTSRDHIDAASYRKIVDVLIAHEIDTVLFNGGNGSMDTAGKIAREIQRRNRPIKVVGIPKTIDNDIAVTDHAPGFGSAARYLASSVQELAADVAALPIHVSVIEAMGRNTGWLTAAALIAKREGGYGPHLLFAPEVAFDEDRFLDEVSSLYKKHRHVVVVASEGLRYANGDPIVEPIFRTDRSVYYGDVSAHLAMLVIKRLGIKARSEKPGILGRSSIAYQSSVDRDEAILVGRKAVQAALEGDSEVMVGFKRISDEPYLVEPVLIPLEEVMLHEKTLPMEYLPSFGTVDESYLTWCKPLIGDPLADFSPVL